MYEEIFKKINSFDINLKLQFLVSERNLFRKYNKIELSEYVSNIFLEKYFNINK